MKEMIERIAKALVDEPENVTVTQIDGMNTAILELRVSKSDVGKIIGKHGRTVGALRTLLSAASAKVKKRSVLEVVE